MSAASLTPAEVARAAPLLIGSGAAALGWRRIKDTPALKACAEAQELCQSGQILALEDARLDRALEFVATRLNEVGIVPLIAKGWAVAHFYSSRYLRAYGDFDLCAPPGQYELARATLLRLTPTRFPESEMEDISVDCGPDLGFCTIDLHKNFRRHRLYAPRSRRSPRPLDPRLKPVRRIFVFLWRSKIICVFRHHAFIEAWRPGGRPVCATSPLMKSRPFRRILDWDLCLGDVQSGRRMRIGAIRSCSRIGCWDAVSTRRHRPCKPILPHGSSARFCANGRHPIPGDSGVSRQAPLPKILVSSFTSFTGCVYAGRPPWQR